MATGDLPQELMTNILSRLSVKSLLRFKCVHKTWDSLLKLPSFIRMHIQNSNNKDNVFRFFFVRDYEKPGYRFLSYNTSNACLDDLETPFGEHSECFNIIGSCHGLVCFYEYGSRHGMRFFVCNLSLKQHKIIYLSPESLAAAVSSIGAIGFGYDSIINDYKLVQVDVCTRLIEVYTLGMGVWKMVGSTDIYFEGMCQAYLNGAIHWLGRGRELESGRSYVVRFDVSSEVLQLFPVPKCVYMDCCETRIDLHGDLLSLVRWVRREDDIGFDIWVMGKYGVEESWMKVHAYQLFSSPHVPRFFLGFGIHHKELFTGDLHRCAAVYHPGIEEAENIEFDQEIRLRGYVTYVGSLVSLKEDAVAQLADHDRANSEPSANTGHPRRSLRARRLPTSLRDDYVLS